MDQSFGEQKQVPNLKGLVEELVAGIDEANLEAATDDKEELSRARVSVRWVDGASRVLEDGHGDALAEKRWELVEGGFCGFEIWREIGESWAKACKGEESAVDDGPKGGCQVVDDRIWVAGFGKGEDA